MAHFSPLSIRLHSFRSLVTSSVRSSSATRIKVLPNLLFATHHPYPLNHNFMQQSRNTHALTMHQSFTCCGCGGERLGGGRKRVSLHCQGLSGFPSEHRACSQCIKGIKARKWMVPCSHLPRGGWSEYRQLAAMGITSSYSLMFPVHGGPHDRPGTYPSEPQNGLSILPSRRALSIHQPGLFCHCRPMQFKVEHTP